jgi:hypothetical protein
MFEIAKRNKNEKAFGNWEMYPDGSRIYWFELKGKRGWSAKYLKEVDKFEETIRFWQEIFNEKNELVEIHEKYPIDKGHIKIKK